MVVFFDSAVVAGYLASTYLCFIFHPFPPFFVMKKAYSHFAALAFATLAFSSCSRSNYATNQATSPLTEASVAQAPATTPSPAAEMSATVVAQQPTAATEATAPAAVTSAPAAVPVAARRAVAPSPAATASAETAVAATAPAAKAAKPTLVQRLALNKVAKQLSKIESRQQNTASTEQTAARSGSITILLVGAIALLLGILIGAGWLTTIGGILILVGLILLLLKAL
jgi:cobalamin biosynthesis Mg chelatase CobN